MKSNNIVTIIQTRTGSTRFPNKVLKLLGYKPVFVTMVDRIRKSRYAGRVVVATTFMPEDDIIEIICMSHGIDCYRGHPTDLLDRHYQTALHYGADAIVKIPSDCPLVDIGVIDEVIGLYISNPSKYDYVSNLHPATFPDGNDVEIMTMDALKIAWLKAEKDFEREHTTPFIWEQPEIFNIANVFYKKGNLSMSHRWCLDYPEDYEFIKTVYKILSSKNPFFGLEDIISLLETNPSLIKINQKYHGVNWYRNHLDELKTIKPEETRILV